MVVLSASPALGQPCNRSCPVAQRGPDGCCIVPARPPPRGPNRPHPGGDATPPAPPPQPPPPVPSGTGTSCTDAIPLVPGQTVSGTTTGGASGQYQGGCGGNPAPERVHALRISDAGTYFIDVTETGFDGIVYLRASCADGASELRCTDDLGDTLHSGIVAALQPGTYYVFADGLSTGSGQYSVTVRPVGSSCSWSEADACTRLGIATEHGIGGATADPTRAESLYQSSCDRGSTNGCAQVARLRTNRAVRERGDIVGPCPAGVTLGWRERACGWTPSGGVRRCSPGAPVGIGCGASCGLGTSTGDPVLVVCEGTAPCLSQQALASDDDSCGGRGPRASFVCPASGTFTALTSPLTANEQYSCSLAEGSPTTVAPPAGAAELLAPCPGSGATRDCGWTASGPPRTCTPGAQVRVGCGGPNCEPGSYQGDPVLRACEGAAPCVAARALASEDDTCGSGPVATFSCPASGVYNLLVGAFSPERTYSCTIAGDGGPVAHTAAPYRGPLVIGGATSNYGRIGIDTTQPGGALHVLSGGQLDARASTGCFGWVTPQPDAIVTVSGALPLLELAATADTPSQDTTLIVHRPDGSWACNDDFAAPARDPRVDIQSPPQGQYDVWVGSYAHGQYLGATLAVTTTHGAAASMRVTPGAGGCKSCSALPHAGRRVAPGAVVAGLGVLGLVLRRVRRRRARQFLPPRQEGYHPVVRCRR